VVDVTVDRRSVAGVYVHLPFCDRICPYCDFAVVEFKQRRVRRYLAALALDIERASLPAQKIRSFFLGGGTPSAVEPSDVAELLAALFKKFEVAPDSIECTLEANPSRADRGRLRAYREAGVNRLSVGVQSFDERELHRLGRDHGARDARKYLAAARRAGYDNLNLDLIAGAPGQTLESFHRTLREARACEPDHVSVYALTIEPQTPYAAWHARDPSAFPDDDAVAELLELAHVELSRAGFRHYEISNFALPARECVHNLGYWRQADCVAFGMSSSGYDDGTRYRNHREFEAYCAALERGASPRAVSERLGAAARMGEAAMLALRMTDGIIDADFRRRFGIDAAAAFRAARQKFAAAGLLDVDKIGARLTDRGRLMANTVCAEFLTPELEIAATP